MVSGASNSDENCPILRRSDLGNKERRGTDNDDVPKSKYESSADEHGKVHSAWLQSHAQQHEKRTENQANLSAKMIQHIWQYQKASQGTNTHYAIE